MKLGDLKFIYLTSDFISDGTCSKINEFVKNFKLTVHCLRLLVWVKKPIDLSLQWQRVCTFIDIRLGSSSALSNGNCLILEVNEPNFPSNNPLCLSFISLALTSVVGREFIDDKYLLCSRYVSILAVAYRSLE